MEDKHFNKNKNANFCFKTSGKHHHHQCKCNAVNMFKCVFHSKMKILSSFTQHSIVPNIKEDILKKVGLGNITVDGTLN